MTVPYKEHQPFCRYCDSHIPDVTSRDVYHRIRGWERARGPGDGVFPIKDREYTGEYAHKHCLEWAEKGGDQGRLAL